VIRIGRSLEVFEVTGNAGSRGQIVISVGVALRALHLRVRTCQGKCSLGMIERSGLPCGSLVANLALLRNPGGDVIGIRCCLKILEMTRDAGSAR